MYIVPVVRPNFLNFVSNEHLTTLKINLQNSYQSASLVFFGNNILLNDCFLQQDTHSLEKYERSKSRCFHLKPRTSIRNGHKMTISNWHGYDGPWSSFLNDFFRVIKSHCVLQYFWLQ